jgi:hypothetical protein
MVTPNAGKAERLPARSDGGNLAEGRCGMHCHAMRRIPIAATLCLAGCASTPTPQPTPAVVTPSTPRSSELLGLSSGELVQRLGNPALQVREGAGLKLQFRRRGCVLDAYLYAAPGGGIERVSHVDARHPSGADMNQQSCIAALQAP